MQIFKLIFPEIDINHRPGKVTLATFVRRKHRNGKHYLKRVSKTGLTVEHTLTSLLMDVYGAIIGPDNFDVDMKDTLYGGPVFYKDEDDQPEADRLVNSWHTKIYTTKP